MLLKNKPSLRTQAPVALTGCGDTAELSPHSSSGSSTCTFLPVCWNWDPRKVSTLQPPQLAREKPSARSIFCFSRQTQKVFVVSGSEPHTQVRRDIRAPLPHKPHQLLLRWLICSSY